MKNKCKVSLQFFLIKIFGLILIFCSCVTHTHNTYNPLHVEFLDDNTAQLRSISNKKFQFTGVISNRQESEFSFEGDTLHWFNNWRNGWTEAVIPVEGSFVLTKNDKTCSIHSNSGLTFARPIKVKLRYKDTYYENSVAIDIFERRLDRITAVVEWLIEQQSFNCKNQKEFYKNIEQYLFPEVFGYTSATAQYSREKDFEFAEGFKWNKTYTLDLFPEHFHEIRNSGTLYRDWIETRELFYTLYDWEKKQ